MIVDVSNIKLNKTIPTPLYYQLKKQILEKIIHNEFSINDQLPNELDMVELFDISRSTVRQAINELVSEGYLYRIKAKGTFISHPKVDESFFQQLESFNNEMIRKGLKPSTKVLALKKVTGNVEMNTQLSLPLERPLIYLSRLRYANEEPVVYLETYLSGEFENLLKEDFAAQSLYSILEEKYNLRIERAIREIEAVNANPQEKKYLNLDKNNAICLVKTIAYANNGIPIEYSIARYRGDRNKFKVELVRSK